MPGAKREEEVDKKGLSSWKRKPQGWLPRPEFCPFDPFPLEPFCFAGWFGPASTWVASPCSQSFSRFWPRWKGRKKQSWECWKFQINFQLHLSATRNKEWANRESMHGPRLAARNLKAANLLRERENLGRERFPYASSSPACSKEEGLQFSPRMP